MGTLVAVLGDRIADLAGLIAVLDGDDSPAWTMALRSRGQADLLIVSPRLGRARRLVARGGVTARVRGGEEAACDGMVAAQAAD